MDGARVLRHVGDLRYADWTMSLRSANSILACTLKRRQPHLKAPFNNIAIFFQITPTFREGQLIYEKSLEKEESGSWMEYRGLPEFITAFAQQNTPPLCCRAMSPVYSSTSIFLAIPT